MHNAVFLVRMRQVLWSSMLGVTLGLASLSACAQAPAASSGAAPGVATPGVATPQTRPAQAGGLDASLLSLLTSDSSDDKIAGIAILDRAVMGEEIGRDIGQVARHSTPQFRNIARRPQMGITCSEPPDLGEAVKVERGEKRRRCVLTGCRTGRGNRRSPS